MPRRPSKKTRSAKSKPRPTSHADSKINKWHKASDIPLDEEDQFHASRDKILLDGNQSGGDEDGDDDEVFSLKGLSDEEDDSRYEDEIEEGDEDVTIPEKKKPPKKPKGQGKKALQASSSSPEPDSEEETWGRGKSAYYSSNAAQLESDDEEANELEEQEAKRLQLKGRDGMTETDFGLDDALEIAVGTEDPDILAEPLPPTTSSLPQDKQSILRYLEKTHPETLALARDWDDAARSLIEIKTNIERIEKDKHESLTLGMMHMHYQALLTYVTTLAFYLHLCASEKYAQRPELLKSHPILARLLTLKQSLATLEDLDFAASDSGDDGDDDISLDAEQLWKLDQLEGLEQGELDDLLADSLSSKTRPKKVKQLGAPDKPLPKKQRKAESIKPPAPVFDLIEPVFSFSNKGSNPQPQDSDLTDAYGEATSLLHADAADKSARRKTLRFHTSKVESASARRQGARTRAAGGDDDLPYRERKKEREDKLAQEAKTKIRGQGGEDLDDIEPEEKGETTSKKRRREDDGSGDEEMEEGLDGYYELVQRKSKEKKEQKKAKYEGARAVEGRDLLAEGGATGPRSLTRAILANKGLTPHRPKSVRNPRVKKRQKFEKAKKKISSQKAVFKGGIGRTGRYDGEMSGISKVVKSIKLGS